MCHSHQIMPLNQFKCDLRLIGSVFEFGTVISDITHLLSHLQHNYQIVLIRINKTDAEWYAWKNGQRAYPTN